MGKELNEIILLTFETCRDKETIDFLNMVSLVSEC